MDNKTKEELIRQGRLKPLSEAFKEYPVEEELHQGDSRFFICDSIIKYGKYNVGDIIYVDKYKYQDGTIGTYHLFVIIDEDNRSIPLEYFGFLISSKIFKNAYVQNELLKKDKKNNLKYDSIVKLDVTYVIPETNIITKIGSVPESKIIEYKKKHNFLFKSYGLK